MEFYNGATLIGTATPGANGGYSYTWANVPYGAYSLTAKATDSFGFSSTTTAVSVIANAPPSVNLTAPANNTVAAAPGSFNLSATASDVDGTIAKVEFYATDANNTKTLIGTATGAPYSLNWTNVPAGIYSLTAVATDNYGASTTSAAVSIISDAPPQVSLTTPANNAVITAPATFTLAASATSAMSSIAKVEFFNGTTLLGTVTAGVANSFSYTWVNVPYGTYSIKATATDGYGISTTTAPITVIANAPPSVNLTGPANNTIAAAPGSFNLSANASDVDGAIAKVEFYANNGTTNTLIGTAANAPYSLNWTNVPAGLYSITAVATDNYGASTTSAPVNVISDAPPQITLTPDPARTPGAFTLNAAVSSRLGSIAKIEFYNGATLIGTMTSPPSTRAYTWTNVTAGSYSITAIVTDSYGISATSAAVNVTVQSAEPVAYYIHADHLDTPREITDTAGNVVWQWDNSDPFGDNVPNENPSGLGAFEFNLRFPGQYRDRETNTFYNINRDYDPAIGRYIQSDPIGLQGGINTYTYVLNNPLSFIDPTGLDVTVSLYPGASGFGHVGIGVNTSNTSGFYPAPGTSQFSVVTGQPVPGVIHPDTRTPIGTITIPRTPAQDRAIQNFINQRTQNPGNYDLNDRNCTTTVRDALSAGGVNTPETILPRTLFDNLLQQFAPRP